MDQTVVKMLVAAGKGAWQARIQWKGKADAALAAGEWSRAIECYQQALRGAADRPEAAARERQDVRLLEDLGVAAGREEAVVSVGEQAPLDVRAG